MIEEAVLIGLAGWRLASLLAVEQGPFEVFEKFRAVIGVPLGGEIKGVLPNLFTCVWCLTIWTTLAMWGIWKIEPVAVVVIAAMAVAVAAARWMEDGQS